VKVKQVQKKKKFIKKRIKIIFLSFLFKFLFGIIFNYSILILGGIDDQAELSHLKEISNN
jgi:hypothetical protein